MLHAVGARLVADGAAELLQGCQIALAGEEKARAAVVPDGSSLLAPVAGFDLSEVMEAEEELDPLPRTTRCITGEARDAGEVGRLIESQEKSRCEDAALGTRAERGLAKQRCDQS